jgi:colanic acid biosynthesis protein WcaH
MKQGPPLNQKAFAALIRDAPLVSIDLIVRNEMKQVLLGKRSNAPAKGQWFVPGGRVYKDERLHQALERVIGEELGVLGASTSAEFLGVFEHLYDDNVLGDPTFGTHYIVLAHQLHLDLNLDRLPRLEHGEYRWWSPAQIVTSHEVHPYTQAYFT